MTHVPRRHRLASQRLAIALYSALAKGNPLMAQVADPIVALKASALLRRGIGIVLTAALVVSAVISFTAIVYSGPLAPFIGTGIGLSLLGTMLMSAVGAFFYTARGTICIPQDVTAIIIALTATRFATSWPAGADDSLVATVAMLVATATAVAGITAYMFGYFRLGFLARFLPYPVIGGFLTATGYLLLIGAIGMCLGTNVSIFDPRIVVAEGALVRWVPWVALGAAIALASNRVKSAFLLPGSLAAACVVFFLTLYLAGIDLAEAGRMGLLLGPFEQQGFVGILKPDLVLKADWGLILGQSVTLIAVAFLTIVGTLLHASGLEVASGQELDLERDLRATGLANIAGALGGGLIGFQFMSGTTLARKFDLGGLLPGLAAAGGCAVAFLFGGSLLSALPVGLFATLIAVVGIDFLMTWLWFKRRQLSRADYSLILIMLASTAAFGLFSSLAIGVMAATAFFLMSFAQIDVVRLRSTLATRRSLVERSDDDLNHLMRAGTETAVLELSGYLFFGTANSLFERLRAELNLPGRPRALIVDLTRVKGIDASVAHTLGKLSKLCHRYAVRLVFCGLATRLRASFVSDDMATFDLVETLDDALQREEAVLLSARRPAGDQQEAPAEASPLGWLHHYADYFERISLRPGDVLVRQGAASSEMFFLLEGTMHAEVSGPNGAAIVVARFVPGAPIGEIAFYSGVPRTATVVADTPATLMQIDASSFAQNSAAREAAPLVHAYVATSLARRLRNATLLLRDAEL
jgi:sulfate permease, SulP family